MMNRVLVLFSLFILFECTAVAQDRDEPKRGFIGFSAGTSFPVGNFGLSEWNNDQSGYGVQGFQFSAIEFGIKFVPNFGLTAAFKGANIPMDVKKIADLYAEEYGGQFTVKSSRWNFGGLYVGPFVSIPSRIVDIDFKLMTGLMIATSPEIEVIRDPDFVKQSSATGPSFSLALGVTARFHLSKSLSLSGGIEYLSARPIFTVEYSSNGDNEQETISQSINVINASAGIAFRIFR